MEKRVHYLKGGWVISPLETLSHCLFKFISIPRSRSFSVGEKLVNFMFEPKIGTKWPTNLPRFESRNDAIAVCKDLCKNQFLLRSEKQGKGELSVSAVR